MGANLRVSGPAFGRGAAVALLAAFFASVCMQAAAQGATNAGLPDIEASNAAMGASRRGVQGWSTDAFIRAQATLTNNANYGDSDVRAGDLILEVSPGIRFNRQGGRLRIDGTVAFDMLAYVDGTQVNRILPKVNIEGNLEAIENLFFIDASVLADQFVVNPFLPGSGFASTNNIYTSTQARVAPYLKGDISRDLRWLIRSDHTYEWTSQTDNPLGDAYFVRNLAELVRDPVPLGITLRLTNDVTRLEDQVQPDQKLNTALALVDYAFSQQVVLGLRGGYENTTYTAQETSGPIYGASFAWRPSPITSFTGYWEDRFYGASYLAEFSHRQRRVASTASFYRTITTNPQVLFQIPSASNVSGLLDAILIARFPDPVERASQVQDLINRQGLPQSLPSGATIYNQGANIITSGTASWALIGARNTVGFNLFYLKTEALPDALVPPSFLVFNDNVQQGGGLTLSHRVSPVATLNGSLITQNTRGIGQNEGLDTRENIASLQLNRQMDSRTIMFIGMRYQVQSSTSGALTAADSSEASVFTGLFHRL